MTPRPADFQPDSGGKAPPSLDHLAAAVDSIFGFIQRSAEPASPGMSWETIDYSNQPHRDPGIFNGVGGISFFLVDEFRRSGRPEALALSQGAIDWCAAFPGKHFQRGIYFGKTGTALAALHRSIALAEPVVPEICRLYAEIILREPPGPITDIMGGEASNGLYLLKLWSHTQDTVYLRGAERCAEWLEQQMTRDSRGTHCLMVPSEAAEAKPEIYLGAAHGLSGVAHFLVFLAAATQGDRWAALARELLDTIGRYAQPAKGGLNGPATIGQVELTRCQWSHGAVGIGLTYLAAYRIFGEAELLETAVQAAEAAFGYGDFRHNYTQCTGLAGSGELLLETYSVTGDRRWKERAVAFAELCLTYRESTPAGDAWPTDAPGLYSADFLCGAAGVGHFFLRVLADGNIRMPLM